MLRFVHTNARAARGVSEQLRVGQARDFATKPGRAAPARAIKRGADITLGAALALIALPLMLVIAVVIRLDSPGPILFCPSRVGRHGKQFPMLKFRTMVAGAERRLQEVAHLNVANGMVKIPDDPRVTKVGKWLRKYSLDELPQIFNIVAGHMSLVGPRPHDLHEISVEGLEVDPRWSVRPGLTGLWQVRARSDPDLATRVRHDIEYVSNWSLLLDAQILARTVPAVLSGRGGSIAAHGMRQDGPAEPRSTSSNESDSLPKGSEAPIGIVCEESA